MINKNIISTYLIFFLLLLTGCSSINKENYNKIKVGMNKKQVYSLLGEPTDIASARISNTSGEAATWKTRNITILILFLNNKVFNKSYVENSNNNKTSKTEININ